jgi:hypothetical protein
LVFFLHDLWVFLHEQIFSFGFTYLDAFFRVLNGTEEEGAVDQWISIIHQHHFRAQDARHVRLLMGCEGGEHKHSRVIVAMFS